MSTQNEREKEKERPNFFYRNCESSFIFNQNESLLAKRTLKWQLACTKYESHVLNRIWRKLRRSASPLYLPFFLSILLRFRAYKCKLMLKPNVWNHFKIQNITYNLWSSMAFDVNQSILAKSNEHNSNNNNNCIGSIENWRSSARNKTKKRWSNTLQMLKHYGCWQMPKTSV